MIFEIVSLNSTFLVFYTVMWTIQLCTEFRKFIIYLLVYEETAHFNIFLKAKKGKFGVFNIRGVSFVMFQFSLLLKNGNYTG